MTLFGAYKIECNLKTRSIDNAIDKYMKNCVSRHSLIF